MPGGNKRSYVLKQTCSTYDLLLPPDIKGVNGCAWLKNPQQICNYFENNLMFGNLSQQHANSF